MKSHPTSLLSPSISVLVSHLGKPLPSPSKAAPARGSLYRCSTGIICTRGTSCVPQFQGTVWMSRCPKAVLVHTTMTTNLESIPPPCFPPHLHQNSLHFRRFLLLMLSQGQLRDGSLCPEDVSFFACPLREQIQMQKRCKQTQ